MARGMQLGFARVKAYYYLMKLTQFVTIEIVTVANLCYQTPVVSVFLISGSNIQRAG